MHTLYLDESGDWGYPNYDPEQPILCLCGSIVDDEYYDRELSPLLKKLKRDEFGKEDVILHRYKVRGRRGEFVKLKTPKRRDTCMSNISQFVAGLDIKILVAALDRIEHYRTYGTKRVDEWLPEDVYAMLFIFIVERFVASLWEQDKAEGRIIAESRGLKEDNIVQYWYSTILRHGTQFYNNWQFQEVLPTAIEFRPKSDNILGLQVSDWIALPMSKKARYPNGREDKYGEWELYKNKIWLGKNAPARGQIGFKTFPKNLGRKLLNMPLKSS